MGYCRVSTEDQGKNTSIESQIKSIKAFCESQDWDLIEIFEDKASGKSFKRKGFKEMQGALVSKQADMLLVYKLDRLSRSLKDILILVEDFLNPLKIAIKSVVEPFDTSRPEGKLFLTMLGSFAEFERQRTRERILAGKRAKTKNGYWVERLPYGYKKVKGEIVIKPEEFRVLKLIRNLRKEGLELKEIQQYLAEQKILAPKGGQWTTATLSKFCLNPFYDGFVHFQGVKVKGKHQPVD